LHAQRGQGVLPHWARQLASLITERTETAQQ